MTAGEMVFCGAFGLMCLLLAIWGPKLVAKMLADMLPPME